VEDKVRVGSERLALTFFNGMPYLAYYDAENRDLRFAYLPETGGKCSSSTASADASSSSWVSETVDGQTPDIDAGDYPSLAMDSSGRPRIAYLDRTNGDIRYAVKEATGNWKITSDLDVQGAVGEWARIAIEESGGRVTRVHLTYVDKDFGRVKYYAVQGQCTGAEKCPEYVEPPQSVGGGISTSPMYLDMKVQDGVVYIAYFASTANGGELLLVAKQTDPDKPALSDPVLCKTKTSTNWCLSFVDTGKGLNLDNENPADDVPASRSVGQHVSLQIDPQQSSRLHLAYADDANQLLKYAFFGPGTPCVDPSCWQYQIVEGEKFPVGSGVSLALAEKTVKGQVQVVPLIAFKDQTGGDLRVAVKDVAKDKWETYSVTTSGNAGTAPTMAIARTEKEITLAIASVKQVQGNKGILNFQFFPVP
jgi:hypothetical protein